MTELPIKNNMQITEQTIESLKGDYCVAFTGGRDFKNYKLYDTLLSVMPLQNGMNVLVGDADGLDSLIGRDFPEAFVFEADWDKFKKAAGPLRNGVMLSCIPDLLIAFPGGPGTANCIAQAKKLGIPVLKVEV